MLQIKPTCIMWDTGGKVSYTFPSCVPVDFPASDANSAHSPLAEFCVPCVPSGTGGTLLSQPSHKTTQAPCSPPGGPFWPSFTPGGGTDPPPPGQGPVWATQGPVWQKRKKTAQPGKQPPAQMENTPAFDLPPDERFPQKISSGERCEKTAGERPGVAGGVPCRVTSPGRAGR